MPNKLKTCPLCGAVPSPDHAPFCSRGCKDRDLLNWLGEGYSIPGPPADSDGMARDALDSDEGDR